jgi:hypothetical protein
MPLQSPILALEHNVTSAFESAHSTFQKRLQAAVDAGLIRPEIGLRMDLVEPVGPCIARECSCHSPEMRLHVTHLELLWAFIYSWMVMYEEGVQKPMLHGHTPSEIAQDTPVLARARALFEWVSSLADGYTQWPTDLPSPLSQASSQETWYALKANLVFQQAAAFLLAHEFVHATSGHLDLAATVAGTPEADSVLLELEKEADNAGLEILFSSGDNRSDKLSKAWAITAAALSSYLLLPKERRGCAPKRHLPIHQRVDHFLRQLNLGGEAEQAYFQLLCWTVLNHIHPNSSVSIGPPEHETAEDALQDTLDRLDRA